MKTVIMAGGKGTRISSIAADIPKPMIRIGDRPVLELEIESLKRQGLDDFTPDDIQRGVRKRPLHGVGCLDKTGKTGQHRQSFLKGLYGIGQQL